MITVSHHMCHILTLSDLRGGGGGGGVEQNSPKVLPQKLLIEIRFQNEILANLTSIKST